MAISAYRQGKLKKNPLLGSSLESDPKRTQQRKEFMALYGEAKKHLGEGREGMVRRLSERYQKFGAPHVAKMRGLGEQISALEGVQPSEEFTLAKKAYESARGTQETVAALPYRTNPLSGLKPELQRELAAARTEAARGWKDWSWTEGDVPGRRILKAAGWHLTEKTKKAKEAYEPLKAAEETALAERQTKIGGLAEQYRKRRKVLEEKAAEYNRFLGA